jgi:hypothetical protein
MRQILFGFFGISKCFFPVAGATLDQKWISVEIPMLREVLQ